MKYNDKLLPKIKEWAEQGLNDGQIAINLGVDVTTFSFWKRTKPEITILLEKARQPIVTEVENALLKKALGTIVEDITIEKCGRKKVIKKMKRTVPGDVKAMIFYLTNRQPDKWRFANKIEKVTGQKADDSLDVSKLTDEQLSQLNEIIEKAHGSSD